MVTQRAQKIRPVSAEPKDSAQPQRNHPEDDSAPPAALRIKPSWAAKGLFLMASIAAVIYAQDLLMPVVFAFLLALTFSPVRRAASRLGIPSGITAALIVSGLFALVVLAIVSLSGPVRSYIDDAPGMIAEAEGKLRTISDTVETVAEAGKQVEEIANEAPDDAQTVVVKEKSAVSRVATIAPQILAQIVLSLVLLFFILASGDMFVEKTVHSIRGFGDKRRAVQIFRDIEAKLSRYFFTISIINAGLGVAIGLAMWALGMPNPVLFGVIAFVFNYVPYLGAIGGVILSFGVGLLTFDGIGQAVLAGFVYFFLTSFEGQFVTPYAVGKRLKLNTVVVFLAVAFWGWLWSVVGMIVAMPLLIALRVISEHTGSRSFRAFGDFLSARHAENDGDEAARRENGAKPKGSEASEAV